MAEAPTFSCTPTADGLRVALRGSWTVGASQAIEHGAARLLAQSAGASNAILDFGHVERLDTAGAWIIDRSRHALRARGVATTLEALRPEHATLLQEAHYRAFERPPSPRAFGPVDVLADIGRSVADAGRDLTRGVAFLGEVVATGAAMLPHPRRWRGTAVVAQLESIAFRGAPIVALINFLVGAIVAQQGILQLQRFGATTFAADLIGILILRELGVLLTSIMIAGRSGSAITAELGSMKMREEIDALHVMGLNPVAVLILPRLLALMVSLPLLTFIADAAALAGGLLTSTVYGGLSVESFVGRLQNAVSLNVFLSGLIKAPFMGLMIGLIASVEGLAVQGSAESLGRRVTASVVKSIFMVIVLDGMFAVFFAGVHF